MAAYRTRLNAAGEIAVLAVLYYVCGRVGLMATSGVSNASLVWPAGGLAWAAVLVLGPRVVPGVWLGSFALNLQFLLPLKGWSAASFIAASTIATGSALQVLAAFFLIRSAMGRDVVPRSLREILLFMGIAAACCVVAPTLGMAAMCGSGAVPWQKYWEFWRPWWAGDVTGVLIVTPVLWTWGSAAGRGLLAGALFPLVSLGVGLSYLAFLGIWKLSDDMIAERFARNSADIATSVRRSLDASVNDLESIAAFDAASNLVERGEFRAFVKPLLSYRKSATVYCGWVPRVSGAQRAAFVAEGRREGFADFEIEDLGAVGKQVPSPDRTEYFPIFFIEPAGKEGVLGSDLASDPVRRRVIEQIRDSGKPVATPALYLLQDRTGRKGISLFWPIYGRGAPVATPEQRHESLAGFYVAAFRIGDLMEEALKYLGSEDIDVYLLDDSAIPRPELLHFHPSRPGRAPGPKDPADLRIGTQYAQTLEVGTRKWTVICKPAPEYFPSRRTALPWTVLFFGLSFIGLLGAFIGSRQRSEEATRRLNAELEARVELRTAELRESQERFQAVTETAHDAIVSADSGGRIIGWNRGARAMFGYEEAEMMGKAITLLMPERRRLAPARELGRYLAKAGIIGRTVELRGSRKDGAQFPVEVSFSTWKLAGETFFSAIMRDITERKRASDEIEAALKRELMLKREIHHRVKNNLQVISSLLYLQSADTTDPKTLEALREAQSRAHSIALIHEKLYSSSDMSKIEFAGYIRQLASDLVHAYEVSGDRISLAVNSIEGACFGLDEAVPCGLIVSELISNALKHAFPRGKGGSIAVDLTPIPGGLLEMSVRDDGVGLPTDFDLEKATTFGLKLLRDLTRQLGGTIRFQSDHGTAVTITFADPNPPSIP